MTIQYIYDTIEKHKECKKCSLYIDREKNNEQVSFGTGMIDAQGLIIVPKPRFKGPITRGPYSTDSEETEMLKGIFKTVGLIEEEWWITSAIGCKGELTDDNIASCRDRLNDIIWSISPRVIVCCGRSSLTAFAGSTPEVLGAKRGEFRQSLDEQRNYYRVYLTYDFTQYIKNKADNVSGWEQTGDIIIEDWQNIKTLLENPNE